MSPQSPLLLVACAAAAWWTVVAPATLARQPGAISGVRFENVSAASGLAFTLDQHPSADKHMVETMAGGLAVFDYDGDGLVDVFFTNGAPLPAMIKQTPAHWNRLFRNTGNMTWVDVTEQAGVQGEGFATGASAADFDNDGDIDLFVAGVQRNQLLQNMGGGRFRDVTTAAGVKHYTWSVASGWFDYDNDGRLDLFIVNYVNWSPAQNRFCGDRARDVRVYCHPKHYRGLANALFRNRGDGTFEDVSVKSGIAAHIGKGMSVAFADYDGDGFQDAFVTNDGVPDFLFHNKGNGTFEEVALLAGVAVPGHGRAVSSMGADFRDYDNDGRPDLHVTALTGETLPLFKNENGSFFRDVTYSSGLGVATVRLSGWGNALVDLDNDGFKDLVTANSHANDRIEQFEATTYRQTNAVFRNVAGKFTDVSAQAGPDFAVARPNRGLGVGDFDNDGRMDLVVSVLGERPLLLRNITEGGSWLTLRLVGQSSNRDGIGAVVRVGDQTEAMTSSVGYASSSLYGVHLGLGRATAVPKVEIAWPSGITQIVGELPINTVTTLREPARPN